VSDDKLRTALDAMELDARIVEHLIKIRDDVEGAYRGENTTLRSSLARCEQERDEAREAARIVKWADDTRLSARLTIQHREASANWERLQMRTVRERDSALARAEQAERERDEAHEGMRHFAESRTAIAIDMASKLADMEALHDQAAAAERAMEHERDAYRSMLCDLTAAGLRGGVPESIWMRARELLRDGPHPPARENP
jgi:hypothetical protein